MTWPPPTPHVAAIALVVVASVYDLRTKRLPNALTLGAAAVGLVTHVALDGWSGLAFAASGWAVGLVAFLPFFLLGGMGAGDVKLLAAIGAWLGPWAALWTAVYGGIAGGVMALVVALSGRYLRTALRNLGVLFGFWRALGVRPVPGLTLSSSPGPRLPYALPLAAGVMVTLWML